MPSISDQSLLVRFMVRQWTAKATDKKASNQVADTNKSDPSMGRFEKRLLKSPALDLWNKTVGQARIYHYMMTLPWDDGGIRILPTVVYDEYTSAMRDFRTKAFGYLEEFAKNYDDAVEKSRAQLGDLFDSNNYPTIDNVKSKFDLGIKFFPVPTNGDWRVDMSSEDMDNLKADLSETLSEAQSRAVDDLWNRLENSIGTMAEKLSLPDATFRNSLVENMRDVVKLIPKLNVMQDHELAAVVKDVSAKLCARDSLDLRADKALRDAVAADAKALLGKVVKRKRA